MSKLSLSKRFTLILTAVFLVGIVVGGTAHWRVLQGRAQDEISAQGTLLIESMNAVRIYTSKHVRPLLKKSWMPVRILSPKLCQPFLQEQFLIIFGGNWILKPISTKKQR